MERVTVAGVPGAGASFQRAEIQGHLAGLPIDAPLRGVVGSAEVEGRLAAFEQADARALAAQGRYRTWAQRGLRATTFGVVVGALLLFPLDHWFEGTPRVIFGALQTLALFVTFGASLLVGWLKPLEEWMAHRAEAEELRGEVFKAILDANEPAADQRILATQKLGLLEAAYINDQLAFFDKRSGEHARRASKLSPVRILGYALVVGAAVLGLAAMIEAFGISLPAGLGALAHALVVPDANRWQLGIATMASGILSFANATSLVEEDERKSKLYRATALKLRKLLDARQSAARAAAQAGDGSAVQSLFHEARAILEREHAVWSFVRVEEGGLA